jgi:hypothetical protein|tara:strand:- start:1670 stop:1828 length:159 start_codon:yes stop_codon:yes gene_type:complete
MSFLIATLLSCAEAKDLISSVSDRNAGRAKPEIIAVVKDSSEPGCDWDATAD